MFISKRKIKGKYYFYLEDRINKKRVSLFLGKKEQAQNNLKDAFSKLVGLKTIEAFKSTKKIFEIKSLTDQEVFALEKLKLEYELMQKFFKESFSSFKEDEFIRYAQGSTSVEGNSLSLQEATLVLTKGLAVTGKKVDEVKEMENMLYAAKVSGKIKEINENNIKRIHSAIMKGFEDKKPGEYRQGPMFITGSKIQPTQGALVPKEMKILLEWYNQNKEKMHPLELASEFHIRFEEIHPFLDGNGRTGREILNTMLNNANYPRTIINLENRQSYINILEKLQLNKEYNKFSKFVYLCLEKRADEIKTIIENNKSLIFKKLTKKRDAFD
jgi:Fic family protein